jgi:hypothetical protein
MECSRESTSVGAVIRSSCEVTSALLGRHGRAGHLGELARAFAARPAEVREGHGIGEQAPVLLDQPGDRGDARVAVQVRTSRIRVPEHEVRDAIRVGRREGHRGQTGVQDAHERRALDLGDVEHPFQVGDLRRDREVRIAAVGETGAARVVADQAAAAAQAVEPRADHVVRLLALEVREGH